MSLGYVEHPEAEDLLVIEIPGKPIPKGRPRITRKGHAYTPAKTRSYENDIRVLGRQQMAGRAPYSGPLIVSVHASFLPPTSWPKWKRDRVTSHGTFIAMTTKPDVDNLGKVIDGLNGVVWVDDSQIVHMEIHKSYSLKPKMTIAVRHRAMDVHSNTARKP